MDPENNPNLDHRQLQKLLQRKNDAIHAASHFNGVLHKHNNPKALPAILVRKA